MSPASGQRSPAPQGLAPWSMLPSPSRQQSVLTLAALCHLGVADESLDSMEIVWGESLGQLCGQRHREGDRVCVGPELGLCGGQLGWARGLIAQHSLHAEAGLTGGGLHGKS